MGMPVNVEIVDAKAKQKHFDAVFDYLVAVDKRFSTYKTDSEISKINRGEILPAKYSKEMKEVFKLCEETKKETLGFFDIEKPDGLLDPSGLVKGWAIYNAGKILKKFGLRNFYVDVAGDIEVSGKNGEGKDWSIGVRNPFRLDQIVKIIYPRGKGVATSGTYMRGEHIYNPHIKGSVETDIVSLTVIGPNVYEADRFSTPAFAMGEVGLSFLSKLPGFDGFAIYKNGMSKMTRGFEKYTIL